MPSLQSDADSMLFKLEQPDSQGDFVLYLWTDSLLSHLLRYSICFSVVVASPHCLTKNIWFVLLPFPSRAGTYTPYKGKKSHSNKLHVWQKHTLHVKHEVHQHSNLSITNIYTNAISATGESYHTVLTLLLWVLLTVLGKFRKCHMSWHTRFKKGNWKQYFCKQQNCEYDATDCWNWGKSAFDWIYRRNSDYKNREIKMYGLFLTEISYFI